MADPRTWFTCRCGVETTDPPGFPAPCRCYASGCHVWQPIVGVGATVAALEDRVRQLEGLLREFQRCGEGLTTSYIDWEDEKLISALIGPRPKEPEAATRAANPPTTKTLVGLWSSETEREARRVLLSLPNPFLPEDDR